MQEVAYLSDLKNGVETEVSYGETSQNTSETEQTTSEETQTYDNSTEEDYSYESYE